MMKKYYVNWSVEGIVSNWGEALGRWMGSWMGVDGDGGEVDGRWIGCLHSQTWELPGLCTWNQVF